MTDIVERIRSLRYVHVPVASQLMAEAAAEIERLRNGAAASCETVTLTDEEREAIEWFAEVRKPLDSLDGGEYVATLRKLLGRRNHDAVPEAKARTDADSLEAIVRGEVDSPQPFAAAYAVYLNGEYDSSYGPDAIDEAMEIAADCNGEIVPLYRSPTLTDEERAAIYRAEARLRTAYVPDDETAATLRKLLARLAVE
jgi:hypothetical protein